MHSALLLLLLSAAVGVHGQNFYKATVTFTGDTTCKPDLATKSIKVEAATAAAPCTPAACSISGANSAQTFCFTSAKTLDKLGGPAGAVTKYDYTAADCASATSSALGTPLFKTFTNTATACAASDARTCAASAVAGTSTSNSLSFCETANTADELTVAKLAASYSYTVVGTFSTKDCNQDKWTTVSVTPTALGVTCAAVACAASGSSWTQTFCMTSTKTLDAVAGPKLAKAVETYPDTSCGSSILTSKMWTVASSTACVESLTCSADKTKTKCEVAASAEDLSLVKLGAAAPAATTTAAGTATGTATATASGTAAAAGATASATTTPKSAAVPITVGSNWGVTTGLILLSVVISFMLV